MSRQHHIPIVSVVARSGMGKTTLVEALVTELVARGHRVATVKHHRHAVDIDVPGKDSWRHARAGAQVTMIDSPTQFAAIRQVDRGRTVDELREAAGDVDILVSEGFQRGDGALVEVVRTAVAQAPERAANELFALVTDGEFPDYEVPTYRLDDIAGLADAIEETLVGGREVRT